MKKEDADKIIAVLKEKRIFTDDEITKYLESTGQITTKGDMTEVLQAMIRNQDFNSFYISDQILKCAEETTAYIQLIEEISKDARFVPARSNLTNLFEADENAAKFVYEKLCLMPGNNIGISMGYILGGWGLHGAENVLQKIRSHQDPTIKDRIAYTIALQIISEKHSIPEDLVDFVIGNSDSDDEQLRGCAIFGLISRFGSVEKVRKKLEEHAHNPTVSGVVARTAGIFWRDRKELAMNLLAICAETDDPRLVDEVARNLGMLAPNYPIECLSIVRRWVTNPNFQRRLFSDWFINLIGKSDITKVSDFIRNWINEEKNPTILIFHLPIIVNEIYASHEKEFIELLKAVDHNDKTKSSFIVHALDQVLSHGYGEVRRQDGFIDECDNLLTEIANVENIPIRPDPKVTNRVIRTLSVISQIKGKKRISQNDAKKMLDEVPNLTSFIGRIQIEHIIDENQFHPLVVLLSDAYALKSQVQEQLKKTGREKEWKKPSSVNFPPHRYYSVPLLLEVDAAINLLKSERQGLGDIKDALLNEQSFYQTVTELVTAARLKKDHPITLQPRVNGNRFDIEAKIESRDILFEIYSPDMDIRLKYVNKVHGMQNRAKRGILDKLDTQLNAAASENKPVVLIVDRTRSDFGEMEIMDAMLGSYQWVIIMENEKGTVVGDYATRAKDSISDISQHGNIISAIVLVDRDINYDEYKIQMSGKIFVNPQAIIPLDEKSISAIERSLFGNFIT